MYVYIYIHIHVYIYLGEELGGIVMAKVGRGQGRDQHQTLEQAVGQKKKKTTLSRLKENKGKMKK